MRAREVIIKWSKRTHVRIADSGAYRVRIKMSSSDVHGYRCGFVYHTITLQSLNPYAI